MIPKPGLQVSEYWDTISTFFKTLPQKVRKGTSSTLRDLEQDFQQAYKDSTITMYLDDYVRRAAMITTFCTVSAVTITFLSFVFLLSGNPWWTYPRIALFTCATGIIILALSVFFSVYYPYYKRGEAKGRLEDGLIYFLSYMAVLSASGMSIERILERITEVEDNPPLIHLSKKFLMNIRLFGMDVRTALKDIAEMSPSKVLAKQLEAIRTAIATSGDLKVLLVYEMDRQLQVKREKLKAKLNTLVYVGEIYVAMMVITPTLFILVIAILSVLGGQGIGGSAILQLNLLVFVGIPILGGIFLVLLDQTMGREE